MNNIIRKVEGCTVTFHHDRYYWVNGWLERNNISYDKLNILINQQTYQPIPCSIRFHNEQDLTMFLLRWQ